MVARIVRRFAHRLGWPFVAHGLELRLRTDNEQKFDLHDAELYGRRFDGLWEALTRCADVEVRHHGLGRRDTTLALGHEPHTWASPLVNAVAIKGNLSLRTPRAKAA